MRSLCTTSRSDSSRATAQGRSRFHVWRHTFTPRSDLPERRAEVAPEAQSDHTRATGRSRSRFHHPETRERARSDLSQRHSEVAPEAWSDLSERRAEVAPCFVSARTCDFSRAFWLKVDSLIDHLPSLVRYLITQGLIPMPMSSLFP
uniref:Uncharacterized protein n=1 Tax=Brassica campestris TaxID=3711 RepID=M4ETB1_BRACM